MPPLDNPRHERFCLGLAEGLSASAAYVAAGYQESRHSASRLATKSTIKARLAELQQAASNKTELSIQSIIAELSDLATKATNRNQFTAAVKAVVEKARIAGLLVERVEVTQKDDFDDMTVRQILARMAQQHGPQSAWHTAMAFELNPADYGVELEGTVIWKSGPVIEGDYAGGDGKDCDLRHAGLTPKTFKPGVSQRAIEEAKPVNRRREIG